MKTHWRSALSSTVAVTLGALFILTTSGCGGGGGPTLNSPATLLYYPYETVYGTVCQTREPIPGCTFDRKTGLRISVSHDPHYDRYGDGTDDMWYVKFNSWGVASVYDSYGIFRYFADVSEFAGWMGGYYIGVGTTGLLWEDVRNGTYWLGKNGVLYSANLLEPNFGKAINEDGADRPSDKSFISRKSEANQRLIAKATDKLVADYQLSRPKAQLIASTLNHFAIQSVERGHLTTQDVDKTFKTVFGVSFRDALQAVKGFTQGDTSGIKEVTERSAQYLGLQPHQAQKFIRDMYRSALAEWGIDADQLQW
ncbi:MAG: hypothetical protein NZ480_09400 [Bdellovibrionaceae bacterium]|nr:hypothetical protein [Pseudobdellovibrionaceae bacterium]MDW8190164.1 hypothetical protein [Pseudobdellovibrionaceae bacterium]